MHKQVKLFINMQAPHTHNLVTVFMASYWYPYQPWTSVAAKYWRTIDDESTCATYFKNLFQNIYVGYHNCVKIILYLGQQPRSVVYLVSY